jgi:hypothetical protein
MWAAPRSIPAGRPATFTSMRGGRENACPDYFSASGWARPSTTASSNRRSPTVRRSARACCSTFPAEVGLRLDAHDSVSVYFEHTSKAYLAEFNEGMDRLSVRYAYRFEASSNRIWAAPRYLLQSRGSCAVRRPGTSILVSPIDGTRVAAVQVLRGRCSLSRSCRGYDQRPCLASPAGISSSDTNFGTRLIATSAPRAPAGAF